jgi:hypothetical protein
VTLDPHKWLYQPVGCGCLLVRRGHVLELGITCFRRRTVGGEKEAARINAALIAAWEATGDGLLSSTRLGERYAVRLCALNHATSAADVERVLDFFARGTAVCRSSTQPTAC